MPRAAKKKSKPGSAKADRPPPLRLEWRSPAELAENPLNWRRHPDSQLSALTDVISEVGWAGACLFNERTGRLIDGHARRTVALAQGGAPVPVLVGDWTEEQERKILATLDPLAGMAEADPVRLASLLAEVETESAELEKMLAELGASSGASEALPEPGGGGDEFDATPDEGPARTRVGELWVIGGKHRLLVGDCTVPENVARLMGNAEAGALVSDPPYGVTFDTDYTRFTTGFDVPRTNHKPVANDDKPFDPTPFLSYPAVVLWGANCFSDRLPMGTWLIWDKRFKNGEAFLADGEAAWMKGGHGVYIFSQTSQGFVRPEPTEHPTQKPVALMQWCIEKVRSPERIFDPFLGSGTTLVAAHRLNRVCYGCELEPRYADVVLKRAEAEGLSVERGG